MQFVEFLPNANNRFFIKGVFFVAEMTFNIYTASFHKNVYTFISTQTSYNAFQVFFWTSAFIFGVLRLEIFDFEVSKVVVD